MLRIVKPYFHINRMDFPALGGLLAGLFLLWELVMAGVVFIGKTDSIPVMLNVLLPCVAGAAILIMAAGNTLVNYDLCVKLGRTRRETVAGLLTVSVIESLSFFLLAWVLGQLEAQIAHRFWINFMPDMSVDFELVNFCPLWLLLLIGIACALVGFAGGALIQRFGRRAGWTIWGIWMVFIIFQSYIDWDALHLGSALWCLGIGGAAIFLWSMWILLHGTVKN